MIFGFDLGNTFFIHALLHVQDMMANFWPYDNSDLTFFLQSYEIYIGDSTNYWENKKCAGGPFLDPTNPETYIYD